MMLAPPRSNAAPQSPIDGKYRVDHAYTWQDTFYTFRKHWETTKDVALFFVTRNDAEQVVGHTDTEWDAAKWKLVENAKDCEKDKLIEPGGRMGVRLGAYKVTEKFNDRTLSEFYAAWKGKGLQLRYGIAGGGSYDLLLDDSVNASLGYRTIWAHREDSVLGTIVPDGGELGVILEAESPAQGDGPGLIPGLKNAWELPIGLVVGLLIGLAIGLTRKRG